VNTIFSCKNAVMQQDSFTIASKLTDVLPYLKALSGLDLR
jgi:hypothetical protein